MTTSSRAARLPPPPPPAPQEPSQRRYHQGPSLDSVKSGAAEAKRWDKGQAVRFLQEQLNKAGHQLKKDGFFGPKTQRALDAYQQANQLSAKHAFDKSTFESFDRSKASKGLPTLSPPQAPLPPARPQVLSPEGKSGDGKSGDGKSGDGKRIEPGGQPGQAPVPSVAPPASPTPRLQPPEPQLNGGAAIPNGSGAPRVAPAPRVEAPIATSPPGRVELAPRNLSPQQKYGYYADLVKRAGGVMDPNKATVLGMRGLSIDGRHHASRINHSPDDTFVVLDHRSRTAKEISGVTHPAQVSYGGRPTGFLAPGNYEAIRGGAHNGDVSWQVLSRSGHDNLPASRAGLPSTMNEVLFHRGINGNITSAGCQAFAHDSFQALKQALGPQGLASGFHFTLVDAQS